MSIEITDWLRSLGLAQYATAFFENDVDAQILRELTFRSAMSMLKRHLRETSSPLAWPTTFARPATQSNRRYKPVDLEGMKSARARGGLRALPPELRLTTDMWFTPRPWK